jgi:ribose 5-phosphate isomerase B
MRIGLGADHAGCALKALLAAHLAATGHEVVDFGTSDPAISVDYPDYAGQVAKGVASGALKLGLLVCGTGIGMSIAANKVVGVRAAVVHDVTTARLARQHNDANVLCMGARLLASTVAMECIDAFLVESFDPRHQRRLDKIAALEKGSAS